MQPWNPSAVVWWQFFISFLEIAFFCRYVFTVMSKQWAAHVRKSLTPYSLPQDWTKLLNWSQLSTISFQTSPTTAAGAETNFWLLMVRWSLQHMDACVTRDWNTPNDLMYLLSAADTRPELLCYISTSLAPLMWSCASAAVPYGHFSLSGWFTARIRRVFESHLYVGGRRRSLISGSERRSAPSACEDLTSTVPCIMRHQSVSFCSDRRSPARRDVIRELNVNKHLSYWNSAQEKVAQSVMKCCYVWRNVFLVGCSCYICHSTCGSGHYFRLY